jgi:antirestriction protein ArdC
MVRKTARRAGKTPAQRQAERDQLLGSIADKVTSLANSDEWAAYLRFLGAFRRYSLSNVLLILTQCPHATQVAGYRKWQEFGRQVAKGQKAIKILGYSPKKITEKDEATGEERTRTVVRFPVLSVFDVSQTEGDELPNGGMTLPDGHDTAGIWDRSVAWLESTGWTVEVEPIRGGVNGYTDRAAHRVVIDESLAPAGRASVLLHEAGHVVLHEDLEPAEYQQHRGVYETEAESVAYVLANLLGQPADAASIPYIAGWARADRELIERTAANVRRAVNEIAAGLGLDESDEEQQAA